MEKEDIEKIKMYLKEYQTTLYSMHDTAIQGIKLHENKDFGKDPHAQDVYIAAIKLRNRCENKIEDIEDLISRM